MNKEHLIDFERKNRIGIPETIFCLDKDSNQIKSICRDLDKNKTTLFTRLSLDKYSELPKNVQKSLIYNKTSNSAIYILISYDVSFF